MFGFGKSSQNDPGSQGNQQQQPAPQNQAPEGQQQQEPKTGLDKFAHLLDNASNKSGEGDDPGNTKQPTNVSELFKDQNFTNGLRSNLRQNLNNAISPETKALMEANDPAAMQSMMADMVEASYLQGLQHSSSLQNLVMDEKLEGVNSQTSNLVEDRLQTQEFNQALPQLRNPIVKLGVEAFMGKVREQNPTITADEMKAQVTEYVSELGTELGAISHPDTTPVADVDKGIDWFEELGIEAPSENP